MRRHGYTLVETLVVLALLGMLLGATLPPLGRWRDRAAVRAARDEVAAALAWTRIAAVARGGATLVLDAGGARLQIVTRGHTHRSADLRARYRVRMDAGATTPVRFTFDALGIGRLTSRTVRIRRGGAEAGLTVSAYGRVRRW